MSDLVGKVAVVTGASKGIGASIAQELAAAGASVVVNYASAKDDAERVVASIKQKGGKAIAVQGDVSKEADVKRLFAATKEAFGPVDVLVNNAGVYGFQAIEDVTEAEYRRQFDINVLGPLLTTKEAVAHFNGNGGSVINVSSVVSTKAFPQTSVYSATKGALDSVTRVLAVELGSRKIRVNTIAPGGVDTEGARTLGMIGSDMEKQLVAATPLGRIGQPDDIGKLAVFLASEQSGWVTGERIAASGGYA
ncbi:glucose 1-dehydrogenase [Dongia sedimenti]|uniref:Glucose 1-dehydrogenase n=1 Tax=Dongia sedimenti TaxID=3064282 RepID=A0ABU0YFB3_9PROT|nr:glucose 1-dehydrogenase [Rhodospirillaceae bacterium R-7]